MFQIYKITNKINNKVYIGSSINVEDRWRKHKGASVNKNAHQYNYPLMQAFRKYGLDNFDFEIIETVNNFKEMIESEHNWIVKENCVYPNGYNQTDNTKIPMFDPKIAKKMSDTKRKKYGKKVCEVDENNNIISTWDSIVEAAEILNLDRFKISSVCNGKRYTTGNKIFRFIDENNNIIVPNNNKKVSTHRITKNNRKVGAFDKNNNLIASFNSLSLAADFCKGNSSTIAAVCRGKRHTHKGYIWRYLD